jgi:acyl-coenzyme A thioesterase PaaI-like protein
MAALRWRSPKLWEARARPGLVTGTARPVHLGGRTQVWTIDIVNEFRRLVCTSRLTLAVVRRGSLGA